jgi:HSP20 family protein
MQKGDAIMTKGKKEKDGKEQQGAQVPVRGDESQGSAARASQPSRLPAQRMEHPLARFRDEMDALFDRFFGRWPALTEWGGGRELSWGVDVDETDKEVVVRAEAPGFEPQDFDIQVTGNMLTIRAEHTQESKEEQRGYRYAERRFGRFQRSIPLSTAVNADRVEARYHNGILEVHLPRAEESQRKRIEVKS